VRAGIGSHVVRTSDFRFLIVQDSYGLGTRRVIARRVGGRPGDRGCAQRGMDRSRLLVAAAWDGITLACSLSVAVATPTFALAEQLPVK